MRCYWARADRGKLVQYTVYRAYCIFRILLQLRCTSLYYAFRIRFLQAGWKHCSAVSGLNSDTRHMEVSANMPIFQRVVHSSFGHYLQHARRGHHPLAPTVFISRFTCITVLLPCRIPCILPVTHHM